MRLFFVRKLGFGMDIIFIFARKQWLLLQSENDLVLFYF